MKRLLPLLLLSIIALSSVQATVQKPLYEKSTYKFIIDEASLKADLEDNAGIFWGAQESLFKKISSEYHSEVFWEWAPYLVIQHEEQKPLERATINKIDKTLESLNARCRSLVRLVNASKLTLKHRGRIVKRKSEKDAAGRVAYAKLKAKQKAHKSCAKAFNCNGTELAELRLAEKEYQKYTPCSDCVGGPVPIASLYDRHCPKYAWDGERYTSYSYGGWQCKAGYKRIHNSCVKE